VIAGEGVAIALVQVGVEISEIESKDFIGKRDPCVPVCIALIGNTRRIGAATNAAGLRAIKRIRRAQISTADIAGEE
jgi:hypothetical protein